VALFFVMHSIYRFKRFSQKLQQKASNCRPITRLLWLLPSTNKAKREVNITQVPAAQKTSVLK
jgi:hypothetical protein